MTCLLRLIGTSYAPDFSGAILFLEDTGEKAYRVDGMFTQLRLAGVLSQIAGLVLGRFDHTDPGKQKRDSMPFCEAGGHPRIGARLCTSGATRPSAISPPIRKQVIPVPLALGGGDFGASGL